MEMSKFMRFADLKARGIVGNWMTLRRWIERESFPLESSLVPIPALGPNLKSMNG